MPVEVRPVQREPLLLLLEALELGLVLGNLLQQVLLLVVALHAAVGSVSPERKENMSVVSLWWLQCH